MMNKRTGLDITIIIPTFNRAGTIRRAVDSVLAQTFANWECIVVDDGSTDDTETILNEYIKVDKRFHFVKRPPHRKKGANACRNLGVENSSANYVTFLDSDDEYLPFHLERRLEHIRDARVGLTFGRAYVFNGISRKPVTLREKRHDESWFDFVLQNNIVTPSLLMRREVAFETKFDEKLRRHQDWDFLMRLPSDSTVAYFSEPSFVIHWVRNEKRNIHFESCIEVYQKFKSQITVSGPLKSYLFNLYEKAVIYRAPQKIIDFYRDELRNKFEVFSLSEQIKLSQPALYRNLRGIYVFLNGR